MVITHGFLASVESPWVRDLEQALLEIVRKDYTVQFLQVLIKFQFNLFFYKALGHTYERLFRLDY